MRRSLAVVAVFYAIGAAATVAVPVWDVDVRCASASSSSVTASVTNIGDDAEQFVRLEVSYLEPISENGFFVRPFRHNALCPCEATCPVEAHSLEPGEKIEVSWDLLSDSCEKAAPGRYQFEFPDTCELEGCLGTYQAAIGNSFDLAP